LTEALLREFIEELLQKEQDNPMSIIGGISDNDPFIREAMLKHMKKMHIDQHHSN